MGHGEGKKYEVQVPCREGRPREKELDGRAGVGRAKVRVPPWLFWLRGRKSGCGPGWTELAFPLF